MHTLITKELQIAKDLAESARELLSATTDSAEEKVRKARERLGVAVDNSREVFDRLSDRASAAARAADGQLREHPYVPVFVALGLGILLGAVLLTRSSEKHQD